MVYRVFGINSIFDTEVKKMSALLDLVDKMYSKMQSCWPGSGRNHRDSEDTKIDPM